MPMVPHAFLIDLLQNLVITITSDLFLIISQRLIALLPYAGGSLRTLARFQL